MRSLFLRIFLSLAVALTVISLAVVLAAVGSSSLPLTLPVLARAFLAGEIESSGASVLALYRAGGADAVGSYFSHLREATGTAGWLLHSDGQDVLGQSVPDGVRRIALRAIQPGVPIIELHRFQMTAATRIENAGAPVVIVFVRASPFAPRARGLVRDVAPRYLAGLAAALAFSYFLARVLAAPVAQLRQSMRRYGGGSGEFLLPGPLLARKDELGDLAREFEDMRRRINALLERQRQLIGDISHELRSPLTRLTVALEIMRESESREPELLDRMTREITNLDNLIQQLLRLAALEQRREGQRIEWVALGEILGGVVDNARFEAAKEGKSISYDPAVAELLVQGDEFLLASAFENILRNAIRYTPSESSVDITVGRNPVRVTIRDHGPGVPSSELGRIFDAFYRIGTARDRQSGGAGLGLSIAARGIAVCGGTVAASNHPEGGLVVEVRLPST